jgi:ubiquinone/menaquinone biosynthesis C-methylase UbiE
VLKTRQALDARVSQEDVADLYDRLSRFYDLWGRLAESHARTRAIELAAVEPGQTILEVAVGTGLAFLELVKRNPTGTNIGIDLSPGMLAKARARLAAAGLSNCSLRLGSAFELDVEDASVDTLVNNYMFDLIPFRDMDRILAEFKRVLKPGGKLVLVNMTEPRGVGARLYQRVYRLSPKAVGGCRGVRMAERLVSQGLRIETREYYQQILFPSEVIAAYKTR